MIRRRAAAAAARRRAYAVIFAIAAASLAACGSDDPTAPRVRSGTLSIAPSTYTIFGDEPVRLLPKVARAPGDTVVPAAVQWSSSDTTVAIVDAAGVVRGVRIGDAWIRGEAGDAMDSAHVGVTGFTTVAAGDRHSCGGVSASGTWCWGDNTAAQLGLGASGDGDVPSQPTPQRVHSDLSFTTLVAGGQSTCGLATGGGAWCWGGYNAYDGGQLTREPVRVASDLSFKRMRVGPQYFCGVSTGDEAYCAQTAYYFYERTSDVNVRDVSDGGNRRCEVSLTGELYCEGQPLTPFGTYRSVPTLVTGTPALAAIAVGGTRTCGLESSGTAWCWTYDQLAPDAARVPGGLAFVSLDVNGDAACGVTTMQALYCWGSSTTGQLPQSASGPIPVRVAEVPHAVAVDLASTHGCAITRTGAMYCWGANGHGELGDGTYESHSIPTLVARPTP